MKITGLAEQVQVKKIQCDRCGRVAEVDALDCEFHESTSISFKGGYGSIFGDGNQIEVDLCQHCLKETLGSWLRITDPFQDALDTFDFAKHGGEFPADEQSEFVHRGLSAIARSEADGDWIPAETVISKLEAKLDRARNTQRNAVTALAEHSVIVINRPFPHLSLTAEAQGVIVHVHKGGEAYEVELFDASGQSLGVEMVEAQWITQKP